MTRRTRKFLLSLDTTLKSKQRSQCVSYAQAYLRQLQAMKMLHRMLTTRSPTRNGQQIMKRKERPTKNWNENLRTGFMGRLKCKCSNCGITSLQNISECYCCSELEGCLESMKSDLVLQDLAPDATLTCITKHPGFQAVCLQKWSLRLAAGKYKTKGKQMYRQTGCEESFLRGVSYREFSRLVYGMLGAKRIPLPACAYVAIRNQFPVNKDESFTGFDLDEED
ncbi:uncharacterized protein [Montipora foliosa]|uniref:uncharacterized protein isoform X2 n=1 Tax=Montipora foliosa TaxID=591990 RepID=UPI0035F13F9E